MTLAQALARAAARMRAAGVVGAERDARWLLAHALNVDRDRLAGAMEDSLTGDVAAKFETLVRQRLTRRPVSQITGKKAFWGREFIVTADVLTPRPETETLITCALYAPFRRVLDLGTGSGAILVTLLAERPEARGVGTDVSAQAVLVAGLNAERHGVADRLLLPLSDWWDDVGGRFDLIVSNPPYIAASEMEGLAPEVAIHEPCAALTDGGDGLGAYRAIVAPVADHLTPGGRLLVEIGPTQASAVADMMRAARLEDINVHFDLDGRPRVVEGRASV